MNPDQPATILPKQQVIERLKQATNVLVTVSNNPSVDQLASCIGLTLLLNKIGKHATAVFSGAIPSTIEFLQPEKTIKKNTDSLRDFIISLDKAKADKLRYKVEDTFVKIFITPYHTSLSENDLEFSQGDFNVDVVVTLGVNKREELDQTIIEHGRILHDATVISINNMSAGELGSIHWEDTTASSLSEMLTGLGNELKAGVYDMQIATAFLTGIVAQTDRFSNAKTSPKTLSAASTLMASGANQQLVSSKLEEPKPVEVPVVVAPVETNSQPMNLPQAINQPMPQVQPPKSQDGELEISHQDVEPEPLPPAPPDKDHDLPAAKIDINSEGIMKKLDDEQKNHNKTDGISDGPKIMLDPPKLDSKLSANAEPEHLEQSTDPLTSVMNTQNMPILEHKQPEQTLSNLEKAVDSPHISNQPAEQPVAVDTARQAVEQASALSPTPLEPIQGLGTQNVNLNLGHAYLTPNPPTSLQDILKASSNYVEESSTDSPGNPLAPPPVSPPPMMPPNLPV